MVQLSLTHTTWPMWSQFGTHLVYGCKRPCAAFVAMCYWCTLCMDAYWIYRKWKKGGRDLERELGLKKLCVEEKSYVILLLIDESYFTIYFFFSFVIRVYDKNSIWRFHCRISTIGTGSSTRSTTIVIKASCGFSNIISVLGRATNFQHLYEKN